MDSPNDIEPALSVVEDILHLIRSKNRLAAEEWEDFHSWAWVKLVESNYAAIRKFDGRGTLRAYLSVVLSRFLLDYRAQKWGKWRPSAKARELGPVAVSLEHLIHRRGYSLPDAIQTVLASANCPPSEEELYQLATKLPVRHRDRTWTDEWIENIPCSRNSPEEALLARESEAARAYLEGALERSLSRLTTEERVAIKMRFEQGLSLNVVARALGRDPKRFYKQFERILKRLERSMKREGVKMRRVDPAVPRRRQQGETAGSVRP
jgi:RNA polymerase sigma factor (sigma-70 family)